MLIDTHCHIHEANYPLDIGDVMQRAHHEGIGKMICVGTSERSSREAAEFASQHDHVSASLGVHPHDTKDGYDGLVDILESDPSNVVAIGEIGLDYFYTHSPREVQITALKAQIELALAHDLPIIFHVREAFDDFWPIFDSYGSKIRGVLHSFTDSQENMEAAIARRLYIGVNGISTFTKDEKQKEMLAAIPLDKLLLETDAPFLTPTPFRGKVNEPAFVRQVAEHHARIRGLSFDEIATHTSANAHALFAL
ncbi:MAG TPA: TatD family hydrolase [Candidatus Saccharimonadales bacterium]